MNRKISVSNAMMASLGITDIMEEKTASHLTPTKEDNCITKYAGIHISNPTYENIDNFMRKYVLNEMSFFPKVVEVKMDLIPSEMDNTNKDHISEATGVMSIVLHDKSIELPFVITEGELAPFDVIQIDGTRVPFSRENLTKVVLNLDKQVESERNNPEGIENPYLGTEQPINPATVTGFMGDVMEIRDTYMNRRPGGKYVTANTCVNLDGILEKVASVAPMTEKQFDAIAYVLNKKAHDEHMGNLEKLASEIDEIKTTRKDVKNFEKFKNINYIDASQVSNGETIVFPEQKGNELTLTPAIVFTKFETPLGNGVRTMVVANDGRIKLLKSGDKFLCIKAEKNFTLPRTELAAVEENNSFFALKGDDLYGPFTIREKEIAHEKSCFKQYVSPEQEKIRMDILSVVPVLSDDFGAIASDSDRIVEGRRMPIVLATEDRKFDELNYTDFIKMMAMDQGLPEDKTSMLLPKYRVTNQAYPVFEKGTKSEHNKAKNIVVVSSPQTKVFKINGVITTHLKDKGELDHLYKLASTGYDLTEKSAMNLNENIRVECIDRKQKLFNVSVNYRDKDKRFMNARRQNFDRIGEQKLRAFLHILKFDSNVVKEIVYKAKNEPRCFYPLPAKCTTEDVKKLEGGSMINLSTRDVKKTVNKFVNPSNIAMSVSTALISGLAADTLTDFAKTKNGLKVFDTLKKFANESKALSVSFEKLAKEHENVEYLDYAKAMALSYHLNEKVATAINDTNNVYPDLVDAARDITASKELLEKFAYDLTSRKINQQKAKYYEANPNYLVGAVNMIDNMYKVAGAIENSIDKSVEFGGNLNG